MLATNRLAESHEMVADLLYPTNEGKQPKQP
jgi:hypothetical protein